MELTNNPGEGTGYTPSEAAEHISTLLDSDTTTTEIEDADSETLEVSDTSEDDTGTEAEFEPDQLDEADEQVESDDEPDEVDTKTDTLDENTPVALADGSTVTLKELQNGYLRHSDFTRKTQEVAELRKHYESQQKDVHAIRAQVGQHLNVIKAQLAAEFQGLQEPDWAFLKDNDPGEFVRQKFDWDRKQEAVKQLWEAEQVTQQKNEAYLNETIRQQKAEAFVELKRRYPDETKDTKTHNAFLNNLSAYLSDNGFAADEIDNVADARIIDIAYRAYKYDQMQKKIPAAVKKIDSKPALTLPGSSKGNSSPADSSFKRDVNRLKQSGSVRDAASVISRLL